MAHPLLSPVVEEWGRTVEGGPTGGGARYWGGVELLASILLSPSTLGGLRMSLDPLLGKCIVLVLAVMGLGDGSVGISLHAVARGVWVVRDHSHRSTSAAFDLPPKV